jgi:hypothetical protein
MSKFNVAQNGHYFLTQPYPTVDDAGEEDVRVSTYQVHPRGDKLLRLGEFRDGDTIPKDVFYLLAVEGELYSAARGTRQLSISHVPHDALELPRMLIGRPGFQRYCQDPAFIAARYACDVFLLLQSRKPLAAKQTLASTALLCLARHIRQHHLAKERAKKMV